MINHKKQKVSTSDLNKARNHVADWKIENAKGCRKQDLYAPHVTEEKKDYLLKKGLAYAEEIREGLHDGNFTIWQRMNYFLTGECVALMN